MNCEECTLNGKQVKWQVPTTTQYRIMVIGQAPGEVEVLTNKPFTGPAGKMLYALLGGANINKNLICVTNMVSCRPGPDAKGNDLPPTEFEIQCCEDRLIQEIGSWQPELIIALGGVSAQRLTGKLAGITSLRGAIYPLIEKYKYSCDVLCALHPSFVMRQRQWIDIAVKDFNKARDYLTGALTESNEPKHVINPSLDELVTYLDGATRVAFDVETTGLNTRLDKILGIAFSKDVDSGCAMYFSANDPRIEVVKQILEDPKVLKIAQNASFDCDFLINTMGIDVQGLQFDTRLAEQMLSSDTPTRLDHLRAVYTDIPPYKPSEKEMAKLGSWGMDRVMKMNSLDTITTYRVCEAQENKLTKGQSNLLKTLLVPLVPVLNRMERKGVYVNIDTLAGMYAQMLPKAEELKAKGYEQYGINIASPTVVSKFLGLPNSGIETLEAARDKGHVNTKVINDVLEYRVLSKGASTYLKGIYGRLEDSYIHTEYLLDGTGTGRLSSRNPNLQNVQLRYRCIYEAEPGMTFLSGDYKQLELWVAALLGPCETLLTDLQNGRDVHSDLLVEIKDHIPERLLWDARNVVKRVVFGTLYGRSARSIAIAFGVSIETAKSWQEACILKYPGLGKYILDRHQDLFRKGFVTTPWGRVRYVQTTMQAVNTPIQSTASDVTLSTLLEIDRAGYDLRLTVHDEILTQVPKKQVKKYALELKKIFERPIPQVFNHGFLVNFKSGPNWMDLKEVEL